MILILTSKVIVHIISRGLFGNPKPIPWLGFARKAQYFPRLGYARQSQAIPKVGVLMDFPSFPRPLAGIISGYPSQPPSWDRPGISHISPSACTWGHLGISQHIPIRVGETRVIPDFSQKSPIFPQAKCWLGHYKSMGEN